MARPTQKVKFFPKNEKVPFIITNEGGGIEDGYLTDEHLVVLTDENDVILTE